MLSGANSYPKNMYIKLSQAMYIVSKNVHAVNQIRYFLPGYLNNDEDIPQAIIALVFIMHWLYQTLCTTGLLHRIYNPSQRTYAHN